MIPFNVPVVTGHEHIYIQEAIESRGFCGDKSFTKRCESWLEEYLSAPRALLTASCTQALEMSAILLDLARLSGLFGIQEEVELDCCF